jgi:hypothetical protein
MCGNKRVELGVVELAAVVYLDGCKRQTKPSKNKRAKRRESGVSFRFLVKGTIHKK